MKRIEAVIQPFKLDEVKEALHNAGIQGITVSEVQGFGRQSGRRELYRGTEFVSAFVPKIKVEIITNDDEAPNVVRTIQDHAKCGNYGDGKIFVSKVENIIRIRTGESGSKAI